MEKGLRCLGGPLDVRRVIPLVPFAAPIRVPWPENVGILGPAPEGISFAEARDRPWGARGFGNKWSWDFSGLCFSRSFGLLLPIPQGVWAGLG